jgi:hypothetical protein
MPAAVEIACACEHSIDSGGQLDRRRSLHGDRGGE